MAFHGSTMTQTSNRETADPVLVGDAPEFRRLLNAVQMVARTDAPILLTGEHGTGKERIAREIHRLSARADGPFVALTCAGLAAPDLETCLADQPASRGGSLFLDEVAELDEGAQARLFHLLTANAAAAPRILSGTTRDLTAAVERGMFRTDLYYRLNVVPLDLPPLRDRVQDIPILLRHFFDHAGRTHGLKPPTLTVGAERSLRRHTWPGNVRELANLCERLAILFPGAALTPENLPVEIRRGDHAAVADPSPFRLPPNGIDLNGLEAELIRQAIELAGGNKSRAARLLGLTRDTLLYRMQKYLIKA